MKNSKSQLRTRRHNRIRAKVKGTAECPRVSVFKSNQHVFAQVIDDVAGKTLFSSKISSSKSRAKGTKTEKAGAVGEMLAQKAKEMGITEIIFDRGGFKYHGRIKALADGLRNGGVKF